MQVQEIHSRALRAAKNFVTSTLELLDVLQSVQDERVYSLFGHSSLWAYCIHELKLSESDTQRFIAVMRKSKEVPELKKAISEGTIHLSKAARIAPLINKTNQKAWIEKAKKLTSKKLEEEIVQIVPRAITQERIRILTPELFEIKIPVRKDVIEKLKKAQDLLSKQKRRSLSHEEVLDVLLEDFLERKDPVRKAERAKVRLEKAPSMLKVEKKLEIASALPRNDRSVIKASTQHAVSLRSQGCCEGELPDGTRCQDRRFLEIHHAIPKVHGGGDELENLILLCRGHHVSMHLRTDNLIKLPSALKVDRKIESALALASQ